MTGLEPQPTPATVPAPPADPAPLWGVGEVLKLALPTGLSMLNATVLHFVDGLMVSRIPGRGPEALGAQFTAGILSFAPAALMMGTLGVVNTFVSQNLGAGRLRRCSQYAWQGLYLAWAYSLLVLPLGIWAEQILSLLNHPPAVQAMEAMYFRYMVFGQGVFLSWRVLEKFFYGTHRPGAVYVASLAANLVNLAGDYALIFGAWGLPAMGLEGAAIATLVGAGVGTALLGWMFLLGRAAPRYHTRVETRLRPGQMRDLLRVGWPAGLQFFLDILGWGVLVTVLVGGIRTVGGVARPDAGTIHLAATSVVMRYLHVSFMPAVGLGIAATALVGRNIGAGRTDLARRRAYAAAALGVAYMGLCGLAFAVFRYPLMWLFITLEGAAGAAVADRAAEIVRIGQGVMICAAVFQVFDAVGIVFGGALRGAGDTLWPMLVSLTLSATVVMGGGYGMLRLFPGLESIGIWAAGSAFVIALGVAMFGRFRAGHWRKIDLLT